MLSESIVERIIEMSYEAYANHILQKHRLAISLAVIKIKPENISLEDHIEQIRNMMDDNEMEADDLSVCSDDFLIDETGDFDMNTDQNNHNNHINDNPFTQINNKNVEGIKNMQDFNTNIANNDETQIHDTQNENYEIDHLNAVNDVEMIDTQNLNDSITILENFIVGNELDDINVVTKERNSLGDVIDILRVIDDDMANIKKTNVTDSPNIPLKTSRENLLTEVSDLIDLIQCSTDVDATQCESLDISANVNDNIQTQNDSSNLIGDNQGLKSKNDHSASELTVNLTLNFGENNVTQMRDTNNKIEYQNFPSVIAKSQIDINENNSSLQNILKSTESKTTDLKKYRRTKVLKNIYKNVAEIFDNTKKNNFSEDVKAKDSDKTVTIAKVKDVAENSQNVLKNSMTQDFTCQTHYSQSQVNDLISIDDKYVHGVKRDTNKMDKKSKVSKKKKNDGTTILKKEQIDIKEQLTITKKSNKSIDKADISKKLKDKNVEIINEDNYINEAVLQESQMTNLRTPTRSPIFIQNNKNTFEHIQYNKPILNARNANDDKLNVNNDKMLNANNDNKLNANDDTLFTKDNALNTTNSNFYANNNFINIKDTIETIHADNRLNLTANLNANETMQYAAKSTLNTNSNQNAINNVKLIDKDFFCEDSLLTNFSYSTDAFQNYVSEGSFGFSDFGNFETKNKKARNAAVLTKSCATFDKQCKTTFITDQLRTIVDTTQNMEAPDGSKIVNAENSENTTNPESLKSCIDFDNYPKCTEVAENMNVKVVQNKIPTTEGCINSDDNLDIEEFTDSEIEKIPFKIIEELNKVKMFMNKRYEKSLSSKGYLSDTGYRSDSSSLKLSLSTFGIDQSAHSLFNYITECPLVGATQDITEEISLVLGQLIDKLHEEEKYPSFLEDMLETIQRMLALIYQQNTDDELFDKDESIHRIILLNSSIHIQKYTIEKITHTLEKIHIELSNPSFETQNVEKIENVCYIFHLLEVILLKYNKYQSTQNLSQNTQEDEKTLKKSNIMDIWRKKWNPNKVNQNEGSQEKKCVINKCNTVLNKLIVGCMEGYSLISYFALKCFNVIQT